MANTTITVNGKKIVIANKAVAAAESVNPETATESVYGYDDGYDALAMATEAAVMTNVLGESFDGYCKTIEGIDFGKFKKEDGFKEKAKEIGDKIGLAAKKIWTTIANFFRDIGHYISQFVNGQVIKARAAAILKKINSADEVSANFGAKVRIDITKAIQKGQAEGEKLMIEADKYQSDIDKLEAGVMARGVYALKDAGDKAVEGLKDAVDALFAKAEKVFTVYDDAPVVNTAAEVFAATGTQMQNMNQIKAYLEDLVNKKDRNLMALNKSYDDAVKNEKYAIKKAGQPDKSRHAKVEQLNIKVNRIKVKIQNTRVKMYIKCIKANLTAIEATLTTRKDAI